MGLYFRGIGSGYIQSLWFQQVKKASEKYQKASPLPNVERDPEARTVEAIRTKLLAGKKLSSVELDYLREHAPELYEKAIRVAQDRDAYETSLRQSKSQEEVDRKQNQKMIQMVNAMKHCDPEEAQMLMNAIQDANRKYKHSDEYSKLMDEEK
jgi:hypothetical protein